ncbi:ATP-binding protein [Streptomyces sp. 2A115]|uniref:ATP-binding protein n=1 Tax=Streptomyces sp. 2A115 TaxID=3457439 RepID=UPI003FD4F45A
MTTLEWIGRAENLVIARPSGTGKSHFTEGLAQAAIEKDMRQDTRFDRAGREPRSPDRHDRGGPAGGR